MATSTPQTSRKARWLVTCQLHLHLRFVLLNILNPQVVTPTFACYLRPSFPSIPIASF